jgi:hypothetical protein
VATGKSPFSTVSSVILMESPMVPKSDEENPCALHLREREI